MEENPEIPDWLADLRDADEGGEREDEAEGPPPHPQPKPAEVQPLIVEEEAAAEETEPEQPDLVEGLREQAFFEEEEVEERERANPFQFVTDLKPWQRLILSVYLLLYIGLCGFAALLVTGRIAFPF